MQVIIQKELSSIVLNAGFAVHRELGPGLVRL
jgi:hypothetical protein